MRIHLRPQGFDVIIDGLFLQPEFFILFEFDFITQSQSKNYDFNQSSGSKKIALPVV